METIDPIETIADDVTATLMLAMERFSPLERAAFVLRDIFGAQLKEVAATLDRDPAAVRQLASRARRNVQSERTRYALDAAGRSGRPRHLRGPHGENTTALAELLAQNVEIYANGGARSRRSPK